ncbi:unnamed protein product [Arctia plantaginis]|uniref:Uncharacterized protein n=1 Tax=Arctia plantaginis TaxID=874455 RepID=A0A8S1BGC5_ARCPL|nr:unnamed protein product [Arctia plantaginis]
MVFKLIRTDIQEPCKILLQVGKYLIGRGKFLFENENDKRLGRIHAGLEVTEDTVKLKAFHKKPCYYMRTNFNEQELLLQYKEYELQNGDKFGFTPNSFWYQIVHCTGLDIPQNRDDFTRGGCAVGSGEQNIVTSDTDTDDETTNAHIRDLVQKSITDYQRYLWRRLVKPEEKENAQAFSTPNKRAHVPNDSSPVKVKKRKTEPTKVHNAQPESDND